MKNEVRDCLGNPIQKDDIVALHLKNLPVGRVVAVDPGGIHTPQGQTPGTIRVVMDMILKQAPGVPFESVFKLVNPSSQSLIEQAAGSLPRD